MNRLGEQLINERLELFVTDLGLDRRRYHLGSLAEQTPRGPMSAGETEQAVCCQQSLIIEIIGVTRCQQF